MLMVYIIFETVYVIKWLVTSVSNNYPVPMQLLESFETFQK